MHQSLHQQIGVLSRKAVYLDFLSAIQNGCDIDCLYVQVLSATTIIAKQTTELCNACKAASNKTENPVAKRNFIQLAKDVTNITANLVKNIKVNMFFLLNFLLQLSRCLPWSLRESAQIRSFFWSVFSCIRTEYGDLLRKFPYSVQI